VSGAGAVTGVRVGICVGDGVCSRWGGDQVGFASTQTQNASLDRNQWEESHFVLSLPVVSKETPQTMTQSNSRRQMTSLAEYRMSCSSKSRSVQWRPRCPHNIPFDLGTF
jgi:hypothetical protein